MSPAVTPEQWTAVEKLVNTFYQKPDAEPFREPVNWKALGLFDYPKIIRTPMDLGTIKKKLEKKQYKTLQQVNDDVKLTWSNCMTYNADGSDFFVLAESLNKKWDEKYRKLMQDLHLTAEANNNNNNNNAAAGGDGSQQQQNQASSSSQAGSTSKDHKDGGAAPTSSSSTTTTTKAGSVSLEEKRAFARLLFKISKEDLGRVLVELDMKCPAALTKNNAEDECEMNVDKISPTVFAELHGFVKACDKKGGSGGGNKPSKKSSSSQGSSGSGGGGGGGGGSSNGGNPNASSKRQKQS